MRRILLDRGRARPRRGGARVPLEDIHDVASLAGASSEQILAVDEAVQRLADEDSQAASIVKLRFYTGLSVGEAVAATGISPRTAARLWTYAQATLYRDLHPGSSHEPATLEAAGPPSLHPARRASSIYITSFRRRF
jgi:DNA-directed RNA polymerase specialized sigma24 family protein